MATKDQTFFGPPVTDWSEKGHRALNLGFNLLRDFEPLMHELYPESRAYVFGYFDEDDINNQQTIGWRFMTADMFKVENFEKSVGSRFGLRVNVHNRVMHGNNYVMLMSKKYRDEDILPARLEAIKRMENAADDDSVFVHPNDPEYNRMKDAGRKIAKTEKAKVQVRGTPDRGEGEAQPEEVVDNW